MDASKFTFAIIPFKFKCSFESFGKTAVESGNTVSILEHYREYYGKLRESLAIDNLL